MLRVQIGEAADDIEPAIVGKFFASGVEGFDDAIGEKDERVAGLQGDFGGRESRFGRDAEWERCGFEPFRRSVWSADDGRVVAGVDVGESARGGIVLGEDGGGEALTAEAVRSSVVIEADG